jgi:hypothetical protein
MSVLEITEPELNDIVYLENPIVFFENLSIGNCKLTKQEITEYQEHLKNGRLFIASEMYEFSSGKTTTSGQRSVIGWNEEKNGWFYFREPLRTKPVVDIYIGSDGNTQYENEPLWVDGDGVSSWCIPPKIILDVWR